MRAETWLAPEEAVQLKFADVVLDESDPAMVAAFDYTKFHAAPPQLTRLARKNGRAATEQKVEGSKDAP